MARIARLPGQVWNRPAPPGPVVGVAALAALAWAGLALGFGSMPTMAGAAAPRFASSPPWICNLAPGSMAMGGPGAAGGSFSEALAAMPMWSLMAVAMMAPAALPASGHVAINSLRRRRGRAVGEFLIAYLALWVAFGLLVLPALALVPSTDTAQLAAALAFAALWELTPAKRWALNRCHRTSPLPPRGLRASLGTLRFGLLHGSACLASCWALMLVMALAPGARLVWCAGLGSITIAEKLARRPRRGARRASALLGLAAALAALVLVAAGG
jgi:predicted metal-binding membrane protein